MSVRIKWHVIKGLQLFLEHILLNHPQIPVYYLRRLQLVSINCKKVLGLLDVFYIQAN